VAKLSGQASAGFPWRALTFSQVACCAHALGERRTSKRVTAASKQAEAGAELQSLLTLMHRACAWVCRLVSVLALCAAAAAAGEASADGSVSADAMAKVLAGVTFLKEMGNFDNAKHAMSLFSKVADAHVAEARPQRHRQEGGAEADGDRRAACLRTCSACAGASRLPRFVCAGPAVTVPTGSGGALCLRPRCVRAPQQVRIVPVRVEHVAPALRRALLLAAEG
jgi:hypothetical protein